MSNMNVMAVSCLLLVLTFCSVLNVAAVTLALSPLLWHAGFSTLSTLGQPQWSVYIPPHLFGSVV
jgi:hypothetical protein